MTAETIPHERAAAGSSPDRSYRVLAIAAMPFLVVLGAWMLRHPYLGITHDGTLYMLLALKSITPDAYSRDTFFAFGSQGDFTLSGIVLGKLVAALGAGAASLIATALGQAIWVGGAAALFTRMTGSARAAMLPLLGIVCLSASYGGFDVFNYGEGFATPRIYAEGLALWGLWAVAGSRLLLAGIFFLGGLVLHPIMALTGIGMAAIYLALGDRRWWLAILAGLAGIVALAALGVSPLDRLGHGIDAAWLDLIQQRNVYLFPTFWNPADWYRTICIAAFGVAAAFVLTGWQQRLVIASIIAGLGGIAATVISVDLLHNVFAMQIQFYRAASLMHLFGNFAVALLVLRLWQQRINAFPLIALITLAWVTSYMLLPALGAVLAVFAAFMAATQLRYRLAPVSKGFAAVACGLALLAITTAFGLRLYITADRVYQAVSQEIAPPQVFLHIAPIDVIVAVIVVVVLAHFRPVAARRAMPAAAIVMLLAAGALWDRRDGWGHGIEGDFDVTALTSRIGKDATVYFELDARGAWVMLGRATYGSVMQGAGINFSRESALAYAEATRDLTPILGRKPMDIFRREDDSDYIEVKLYRADIASVCNAASDLDFMLLSRGVEGLHVATWSPPSPFYNVRALTRGDFKPPIRTFYLYDCGQIRRESEPG